MKSSLLKSIEKGTKVAMIKKKIITHYIYNGTATITDLAREMDLSVPTITKFVDEMCKDGFINDYGKLETSGGRHPNLYGLNSESAYFVGVELCESWVNLGLMNFTGDLLVEKMRYKFKYVNTPENFDALCSIINKFIEELSIDKSKILNVNVDLPGRINSETGYSHILYNFDSRPLVEIISNKIGGYNVSIDNDTRGMAYGEYISGDYKNAKNVIYINISWGLAMGIIINGKLYRGKSGFAGEFGHNYGYDNEILCHCGKKGCIETEVSGLAIHRRLIEHLKMGESSSILNEGKKIEDITFNDIINAVGKEDILCIDLVEELGRRLGEQIAGLINIFNPDLVIIGGELSKTGYYLLDPINNSVRKYTLNVMNRDSKIVEASLKDTAGIIGACMLSRAKIFES